MKPEVAAALSSFALAASLAFTVPGRAAPPAAPEPSAARESPMPHRAAGTFDVELAPLGAYAEGDSTLARMSIDKRFHGDLEATSHGEMLSAMGSVKGSAGYVAIERVTGKLHGRSGSFVLQHSGTMDRGTPSLTVGVVPDSGTEELAGIAGTLSIVIAEGKHSYVFEYSLPVEP